MEFARLWNAKEQTWERKVSEIHVGTNPNGRSWVLFPDIILCKNQQGTLPDIAFAWDRNGTLADVFIDFDEDTRIDYGYFNGEWITYRAGNITRSDLPDDLNLAEEVLGHKLEKTIDYSARASEILKLSELEEFAEEVAKHAVL